MNEICSCVLQLSHIALKDKSFSQIILFHPIPQIFQDLKYFSSLIGRIFPRNRYMQKLFFQCLVENVHAELTRCWITEPNRRDVPVDPVELSWWVATNLPLKDHQKIFLLRFVKFIDRTVFNYFGDESYQKSE